MEDALLGVEEVATILDLHPKTVRKLIHDGKLKAARAGRKWRIARQDLELLTSTVDNAAAIRASEGRFVHGGKTIAVSAVVNIDEIDREAAIRISTTVTAALMSDDPDLSHTRFDQIYTPDERRVRLAFWGSPSVVGNMLILLSHISRRGEE
ncbi:MAG TPA: helix-turn-helix domain-containing protein [Spirochaetia bacterium]|nr:helix-turn-helix domain-containing protein [Spirochaetia bacterium]